MVQQEDKQLPSNGSPEAGIEISCRCCSGSNFEIRVKGHLSDVWEDWFDGLTMERLDDGEMVLTGPIADQAALMGILNKLSRLNLALLSVNQVKKER